MSQFKLVKATRKQAKARIAITGPSGSGKTTLALLGPTILAGGSVEQTATGFRSRIADWKVFLIDEGGPN
jgi:ABC-type lipoprotein export system ATPase subunit